MKKIYLFLLFLLSTAGYYSAKAQDHFILYTGGDNLIPYNFSSNKAQWLYMPNEFTGLTLGPGLITKFYIRAASTMVAPVNMSVTIKMGTTALTTLTSGPWVAPTQTVFANPTYAQTATANTWVAYDLQTPFFWDATSNLIVEIEIGTTNAGGFNIKQGSPPSGGNRRMYGNTGVANSTGADWTQASIGFDMVSENEMGVIGITKPVDLNDICAGLTKFTVEVKNFGANDILSGNVSYSINNVNMGTASLAGTITPQGTIEVELPGFVQTFYNVPFVFKAWSHNPNNVQDPISFNDTFEITITPTKLGVVLNDLTDTAICKGTSITLDAGTNANTDYTWSNGTQAQHNTLSLAGTYWVWGYNTEGCQSFDTFEVTYAPSPVAALNISVIDLANGTLLFNIANVQNVTEYIWDFGDNSPLEYGAGPKPHVYATAGTYEVKLTMKNACDSIERFFKLIYSGTTSVHELNKDASFEIYPNPVKEYLEVNVVNPAAVISSYSIVNVLGQIVATEQVKQNNFRINTTKLSSGNYMIKVQTNAGEVVKTFAVRN